MNTPAPDLFYEAIGWTHAQCCAWLDEGKDPRREDCGQLVPMAQRSFGIQITEPTWSQGELPPPNVECEYTKTNPYFPFESKWFWCRVVAHDNGGAVIVTDKGHYHLRKIPEYTFRPLPTKEKLQRKELAALIETHRRMSYSALAETIINAGYKKIN